MNDIKFPYQLYPYNQAAYVAVINYFVDHQKACIVHATGTGKSYVIGAVAMHFNRVLVVAPNNFVLDETRKVCHPGCVFRTYASVMCDEGDRNRYDLIVLDEFHRSGAEKWGIGVRKLIEANPYAKLFGTSATDIRYLDNARNMADEMFDGNVVSRLPLKDAIEQHILPNPTYVSSIYTMEETVKSYTKRIATCRKNVDKDELCRHLNGIARNWDNAGGVPRIIRKYFSHDMQRVIVFCSKVKRAAAARAILSEWFGKAGFKKVRYYNIDYKEKRLEKEMADFQEPLGDYDLKVAISVNMLNEGVHVPHVDGIIMLRSTISRIIIEQQVGRCLTANNNVITPVVLDLVNNMDLIRYDEPIFTGAFETNEESTRKQHEHDGFPFQVIDECRDLRILLQQLDNEISLHSWTKEECMESASHYKNRKAWERGCCAAYKYAYKHKWLDDCCAHMKQVLHDWTKEECIAAARTCSRRIDFINKYKNLFQYARKRGWLDECYSHMDIIVGQHTKEECMEAASHYAKRIDWFRNDSKLYSYAKNHGWLDDCCAHMKQMLYTWTKEECMESAKQYKTRSEWMHGCYKTYNYAKRHKWLDDCCAHMELKVRTRTKEECMASARKYTTRTEWNENESKMYEYARHHGWLDECCAHMVILMPRKKKSK